MAVTPYAVHIAGSEGNDGQGRGEYNLFHMLVYVEGESRVGKARFLRG